MRRQYSDSPPPLGRSGRDDEVDGHGNAVEARPSVEAHEIAVAAVASAASRSSGMFFWSVHRIVFSWKYVWSMYLFTLYSLICIFSVKSDRYYEAHVDGPQ